MDRQILEDIQALQQHLRETVKELIHPCKQLYDTAEQSKQEITQNIEQVREVKASLEALGGAKVFLEKLQASKDLLSRYEHDQTSLREDLERYSDLEIQATIDEIEQQIQRCECTKQDLVNAANNIEELRALCGDLLQAHQFLYETGREGFPGFYRFLETTAQSIEQNLQRISPIQETLKAESDRAQTLLEQLQSSEVEGQITELQNLNQDTSDRLNSIQNDLNDYLLQYQEQFNQLNSLNNQQSQQGNLLSQNFASIKTLENQQANTLQTFEQFCQALSMARQSLERLQQEINQLKTDIVNNQQAHQNNQTALVAYTGKNEKRLAQLQGINEQHKQQLDQLNDQLDSLNNKQEDLLSQNSESIKTLENQQANTSQIFEKFHQALSTGQQRLERLQQEINQLKTDIINNQQAHQDNQAALVACTTENEKRLAQLQNINEQLQEDLNQQQTQILRDTESRFVQLQTRISKLDQQFQGKLNTTNRALQQKFRWQIVVGVLSATAIVGGIIGAIVGSYVSVCWLLPSRKGSYPPLSKLQQNPIIL
ncbi:MAG: hypothetical protein ACO3UY_06690, partial [Opitutales bacterium]